MNLTVEQKEQIIKERLRNHTEVHTYRNRQNRLKLLVKNHGEKFTAMAAGLTDATLQQYLRVKHPQSISENTVSRAESVLEGL